MIETFDPGRAMLRGPDLFKRLQLASAPAPLADLELEPDEELVVFDRGGCRYGLKLRQLAYHHVAQGAVNGQATLIAFVSRLPVLPDWPDDARLHRSHDWWIWWSTRLRPVSKCPIAIH